ncbi:FAD-dependent monooxygenase [Methylosinus sp. LW3]|uniref:FAD-dependent monooxygenase n=1 Tax=Methylosinus sp. LW3 TaxID=107635 RepID=UPI000465F473|nr:FAD-dependent monooxygenase [Methylosinus sp. LW3]
MKKIVCIGGGPAGLYFSILSKRARPDVDVVVIERGAPRQTIGWGLILSEGLLDRLVRQDRASGEAIRRQMLPWTGISIELPGRSIRSRGHSFLSLSRVGLISVLQERAEELGVELVYDRAFDAEREPLPEADLVVVSEGSRSKVRDARAADFGVTAEERPNKYIWLGVAKSMGDQFRFIFEETPGGYIWAHCYQFEDGYSTFVVECAETVWRALGFDRCGLEESVEACRRIFSRQLEGATILAGDGRRNTSSWTNFKKIDCARWSAGNMVLLGNAAHSAHYSIGSGTRLALDDAAELSRALTLDTLPVPEALAAYEANRKAAAAHLHDAATRSMRWFETLPTELIARGPDRFAYGLLTRSGRIGAAELRRLDPEWFAEFEGGVETQLIAREMEPAPGRTRAVSVEVEI